MSPRWSPIVQPTPGAALTYDDLTPEERASLTPEQRTALVAAMLMDYARTVCPHSEPSPRLLEVERELGYPPRRAVTIREMAYRPRRLRARRRRARPASPTSSIT